MLDRFGKRLKAFVCCKKNILKAIIDGMPKQQNYFLTGKIQLYSIKRSSLLITDIIGHQSMSAWTPQLCSIATSICFFGGKIYIVLLGTSPSAEGYTFSSEEAYKLTLNSGVLIPMIKEASLTTVPVNVHGYWFLNINILPVTSRTCLAIHISKKRKGTVGTRDRSYINSWAFRSGRTSNTRLLSCLILVCAIVTGYTSIHFIRRTIKSLLASNT